MSMKSEQVIVQNDANSPITEAVIVMSENLNGTQSRNIVPIFGNAEVSATNPLPAGQQAQRDISNLNKRFKFAKFKFKFGNGLEIVTGPYTTQGQNRFIQQIRLAVVRSDGKYVQVQIEDQQPFNLFADEKAQEFDEKDDYASA